MPDEFNITSLPAFNEEWLNETLPQYLRHAHEMNAAVDQIKILYSRISPAEGTVLYERTSKNPDNTVHRQMYTGYLLPAGRLMEAYRKLQKSDPAAVLIKEANLILLSFPNDRNMHLLLEDELEVWLQQHLPAFKYFRIIKETRLEVLRYVPEKRFTARIRVEFQAEDGLEKEYTLIAKQFNKAEKARAYYQNLLALRQAWASDLEAVSLWRLPRALAFDETRAAVLVEDLPGKNLEQALPEIVLPEVMQAVGKMLADFHRTPVQVKKQVTRASELKEIREINHIIAQDFPYLHPRLNQLFEQLQNARWQEMSTSMLLHGSFRLNHILIGKSGLALLDLDSLRMGNPAYDLANFLASLYYLEEQQRLTADQRQTIARYFLEGYFENTRGYISSAAVLWFLSSLLLNKQALKYVTHFQKHRQKKVERMVTIAEAALSKIAGILTGSSLKELWKELP